MIFLRFLFYLSDIKILRWPFVSNLFRQLIKETYFQYDDRKNSVPRNNCDIYSFFSFSINTQKTKIIRLLEYKNNKTLNTN